MPKHGEARGDGYRFWSYYTAKSGSRLELWYAPEKFNQRKIVSVTNRSRYKRKGWPGIKNMSPDNAFKGRARWKLQYAVKTGKVIKPGSCEICGAIKQRREIQGHHFKGYAEPLLVQWLCSNCHTAQDGRAGAGQVG